MASGGVLAVRGTGFVTRFRNFSRRLQSKISKAGLEQSDEFKFDASPAR
ncbi:hypothetical protein [uncultured Campylobacter sp.]|nr:hypothetical protein [uncultured Campylobacter sp.]